MFVFFFSSRRRHTICALVTGVQTCALPICGGALKGPATMTEYRLSGGTPERLTPQRLAAIEALEGEQATMRELAAIAGVSEGEIGRASCRERVGTYV